MSRTPELIHADYQRACALLGETVVNIEALEIEKEKLLSSIASLQEEYMSSISDQPSE